MVHVRGALVSAALACLAGCGGASSNSEWVRTPEAGAVVGDAPAAFDQEPSAAFTEPAATTHDDGELDATAGRQRLSHTVTLGEVLALPPSSTPAAAGNGTTVVVNVTNQMQPAYVPAYGGYGYGYGTLGWSGGSRPSPTPHSASAPIIPGQSWPSVPSYGPSFPYSTSPASPWEHKR